MVIAASNSRELLAVKATSVVSVVLMGAHQAGFPTWKIHDNECLDIIRLMNVWIL